MRALDGLRGIAILMVVFRHVIAPPAADVPSATLAFLRSAGWLGVDLFFVLSGFLIIGQLLDTKETAHYLGYFYARRALRIWPLYIVLAVFAYLVAPRLSGWESSWLPNPLVWLFFVQNVSAVSEPVGNMFGFTWSLAVEEQVYLILPVLILACARQRLAVILGGILLVEPVLRIGLLGLGVPGNAVYFLTPTRLDGFAVGGLLAMQARRPEGLGVLGRWRWIGLAFGAFVVGGIGVSQFTFDAQTPMDTWGFSAAAVLFGSLLTVGLTSARAARVLSVMPLRLFGKYSYAIYLTHQSLWVVLSPSVLGAIGNGWLAQLVAWAIVLPACLLVGWLCWVLIERHALAFKRYFGSSESIRTATLKHAAPRSKQSASGFLPKLSHCVDLGPPAHR